ncbi:MAG: protein kinase domain-containing protein [Halohasta sp.]
MVETYLREIMNAWGRDQRTAETLLPAAVTEPETFNASEIKRVLHLLESRDETVRLSASWTLGLVVSENPDSVSGSVRALASLLESEPTRKHDDILRALGYVAAEFPDLVRDAIEELDLGDDASYKQLIGVVRDRELSGSVTTHTGEASEYSGLGTVDDDDPEPAEERPEREQRSRPPEEPPPTPPAVDARRDDFEPVKSRGSGSHVDLWLVRYTTQTGTHSALLKRIQHRAPASFDAEFTETLDEWQSVDDHDAIVPVVAHGTIPKPWFVVEYQEGGRLSSRLGSISDRETRWIIERVVDAVCHAHGSGVTHGGLTPRNVIFSRSYDDTLWSYPKVSNWGISRLLCQLSALPMGVPPRYAAPEQVAPEEFGGVDASTDIYHLGLIVYELLAGRLPFEDQPGVILRKVVTEQPPPISQFTDDLPESVDTVLAKCFRKSKLYRYNTVQDFRTELTQALGGGSL